MVDRLSREDFSGDLISSADSSGGNFSSEDLSSVA